MCTILAISNSFIAKESLFCLCFDAYDKNYSVLKIIFIVIVNVNYSNYCVCYDFIYYCGM